MMYITAHQVMDVDTDSKLRLLFGGTRVVQHSPPPKSGAGTKGMCSYIITYLA